jgi:hypothetical protein
VTLIEDVARVRALIALATDRTTTEHEARTAALEACRRIARGGLTVVPLSELAPLGGLDALLRTIAAQPVATRTRRSRKA